MKQTHIKILAVAVMLSLAGVSYICAQSDEYISQEDEEKAAKEKAEADARAAQMQAEADSYTDSDEKEAKSTKAKKKGNPRKQGIFKFIYGNGRYIESDEFKIYTPNPFGSLALVPATAIINPKNADAGLRVRFQASNYAFLFNEQMRHRIFNAVDQYLKDFADKKLRRKAKKSYAVYGKGKIYINYGTLSVMMAAEGEPNIDIGYKFKGKSPYFTITVHTTPNIAENKGEYDVKDSADITLYFTKAQAQAMCSMLRDEIIKEALVEEMEELPGTGKTTMGDEYSEE